MPVFITRYQSCLHIVRVRGAVQKNEGESWALVACEELAVIFAGLCSRTSSPRDHILLAKP